MSNFLTIDNLYRKALSIFTQGSAERTRPHKTSNKYQSISIEQIINTLMPERFFPTWATQAQTQRQDAVQNNMAWGDYEVAE